MTKRVLSGIRPTGKLHLGNLLGAVEQFVEMQEDSNNECFFFSADLHALTTIKGPLDIRKNTNRIIREYLASGVNPKKATIYRQSDVPEITYFYTLLSMITPTGFLQRCTTFKEKSKQQEDSNSITSLGLLAYPVLMAADILIVKSDIVPVGHDQLQHLEMTRDIAQKFNNAFDTALIMPQAREFSAIRVPGLDGSGKMGKSDGNTIDLIEDPKSIIKKVKSAKTDSGPVSGQEMSQEMKNLYYLMELCSSKDIYNEFLDMYNRGEQRFYGAMKQQLANDIVAKLEPIRERYHSADCSAEIAEDVLAEGSKKARVIAQEVLEDARSKIGI